MSLRIGELFAGYGGLGMGVQAALGGDLAWYSEIDKGALKILNHRFPDVPNIGDITTVDWSQVEPVDVLTGGSPCQDLSHAGKRAGMTDGTRSNLWVAMREAIAELRPGLVVWENVRGAYSAAADSDLEPCAGCMGDAEHRGPSLRALGRVLGDLSDLGYVGGWRGLRAADVGAPHGRFRVFVVAHPQGDQGRLSNGDREDAPDADGRLDLARGTRPDQRAVQVRDGGSSAAALLPTPATSDTNGPGAHGDGGLDLRTAVSLLPTPSVADGTGGHERRGGARGDELLLNGVAKSLIVTPKVLLRTATTDDAAVWGDYGPAIKRWEQILGRPAPAPTMTSTKGNPQLSPAFVEWLMGLPAGWVTDAPGITRNEALKALGNGVVPQQAEAAVRFLLSRIEAAA